MHVKILTKVKILNCLLKFNNYLSIHQHFYLIYIKYVSVLLLLNNMYIF